MHQLTNDLRSEILRFWKTFSGTSNDLRSEKVFQNLRISDLRSLLSFCKTCSDTSNDLRSEKVVQNLRLKLLQGAGDVEQMV